MATMPAARVWLGRLDALSDHLGEDWLSDDEAKRLQAMTADVRRRSFLAGHWQARVLAADLLLIDSRRIALYRYDDGRPQLRVDGQPSLLSLSISHSGDWLAIALATVPVGVDVELPRRTRDLRALARFTFSPEEAAGLDRLDDTDYSLAFHRLWTLKEARGKRSGTGLLPGESRRVTSLPSNVDDAEATSWILGDGALSVAIAPGMQIEIDGGEGLHTPAHWRYRKDV
ncbi:4'-phosphopantetheinyl transferase family protein [Thermomonas carbonis]|uniref:4'-phosphopantetheinyl transferase superfamily protein n=1 Tax=Thermomonas carbonis TaxID=1463158 RepID=A0A7G9SP42_9GAMM|nr:4'-phosphopantetheinyl transferase superfamily protein [Thermomonas carbonis]QNN69617.1 4'-phosphopantetheinyl transferase superfamily protein [Thermomonas carbonis]GHB94335.1 4'-phosphopantetheinyl transferase [Thermomonas carbonis]